jgi:VanZ family protein
MVQRLPPVQPKRLPTREGFGPAVDVFGGVRASSGAAMAASNRVFKFSPTLDEVKDAAPGDGRTPVMPSPPSQTHYEVAAVSNFLLPFAVLRIRSFIKYWLPVLVWMGIIFSASSDSGSFQHSSRIIAPLMRWLFPHLSDEAVHAVVVFVRKCAHLAEYAVLALLLWRALRREAAPRNAPWRWSTAGLVLALVALYAASDEFHQAFVPSRQASAWDVLLDMTGAAFGLLCLWGIGRLRKFW